MHWNLSSIFLFSFHPAELIVFCTSSNDFSLPIIGACDSSPLYSDVTVHLCCQSQLPPMQLLFSGAARRSLHRLAHSVLLILSPPPSFSPSLHFAPSTSCSSTEHAQYGFLSRCSGAAADADRFYGENGVIEPMMTTLAWLGRKGRGDSFHSSEYVKKTNIAGCWF